MIRKLLNKAEVKAQTQAWRTKGETIGLVPTMGALHEGHLALVRALRSRLSRVVASVFVNPRQFGPKEDFARYPRDPEGDAQKLASAGADAVYLPEVEEIYPPDDATFVEVRGPLTEGLCGAIRPVFFAGVATVVTRLLHLVLPDVAIFGEKDWQQLQVIRRLVRDLHLPVRIDSHPTVRESDGLALSSRNAYLSSAERTIAPVLYQVLSDHAARLAAGASAATVSGHAVNELLAAGFTSVDYFELRAAESLKPLAAAIEPARLFAAVRLGGTRLIDNVPVGMKVAA